MDATGGMKPPAGSMKPIAGLYAVESIFTFLAIVAVGLRLWARHLTKRHLAFNDYAAVGALLVIIPYAAINFYGFQQGIGQHMMDLTDPQNQLVTITKILIGGEPLWGLSNFLIKISILSLYLEIFRGKWFKIACYTSMGFSCALLVFILLAVGLMCRPFEYNWDKTVPGTCGNSNTSNEASGIWNLVLDLTIVTLPMPMLWGLQLPVGKKIGLTGMFGVGAFICIVSVMRVLSLSVWHPVDFTYGMRNIAYWSMLEPTLGIVNCCMPLMGPIISKVTTSKLWTQVSRTKATGSNGSTKPYGDGVRVSAPKRGSRVTHDLEAGSFRRLNDPVTAYYMDDLARGNCGNRIPSESSDEYALPVEKRYTVGTTPLPMGRNITVKQEWQVQHSPNGKGAR